MRQKILLKGIIFFGQGPRLEWLGATWAYESETPIPLSPPSIPPVLFVAVCPEFTNADARILRGKAVFKALIEDHPTDGVTDAHAAPLIAQHLANFHAQTMQREGFLDKENAFVQHTMVPDGVGGIARHEQNLHPKSVGMF